MAGEAKGEGLSGLFNMHTLHWAMLGGMAIGAVAMAGIAGGATIPDLGVAVLDAGWQMLTGLEHIFSVGADVISNTIDGDFGLNYEWGSAAHDMGAMDHSAHEAPQLGVEQDAAQYLGLE